MKTLIQIMSIIILYTSCISNKRNTTASINNKKVEANIIDIQNPAYLYSLNYFKVTPSASPDSSGIIHHGFGITYSIDFEIQLNDKFLRGNQQIELSEIQIVKQDSWQTFEDITGSDTVYIIPKFKLTNESISKTELQLKGSIQFWHFGSTRSNKLVVIFNDRHKEFRTQWHKS